MSIPPVLRAHERGDRRRAELLDGALACLADDGWAGLTHRKVAQRAGATPSLVRYHFESLAGLRAAIAHEAVARLVVPSVEALCSTASAEHLATTAVGMTEHVGAAADDVRLLTQVVVGTSHYPEVADVMGNAMAVARDRLAAHLVALDPGLSTASAGATAALLLGVLDGLLLHGLVAPPTDAESRRRRLALFRSLLEPPTASGP